VYTAGHSSAATLSLLVAQEEPRVSACVAFAPVTDLLKFLGPGFTGAAPPDYLDFLKRSSPLVGASKLRRPLFLFHAEDDTVVSVGESERFAEEVRKVNPAVTLVRAGSGGHYQPMVEQGIPQAIEWLRKLAG
jgi:dipeptidyl aminopeptidase/acylaminoacyl peptidase